MGNSPCSLANVHLSDYVRLSISDSDKTRGDVQKTWKQFYASWIGIYSKNRKQFVAIGALCNSVKITKITNIKKEIWLEGNHTQCDSMFVVFEIYMTIRCRKQSLNLKCGLTFDDKFSLYDDDNKSDKYNTHWAQSLLVLDHNVQEIWLSFLKHYLQLSMDDAINNKIACIIIDFLFVHPMSHGVSIIENGTMDQNSCLLIAAMLFDFDKETSEIICPYFNLLWKWFLSKTLITFRKQTVQEQMVWRRQSAS
eukprot:178324_1